MTKTITNAEELIGAYYGSHPNGHYFDYDTLKFFGERRSEMRLLKSLETVTDWSGEKHTCYVISSLQRNYPGGARRKYHYFDTETFNDIQF